jgi:hypothetical protein
MQMQKLEAPSVGYHFIGGVFTDRNSAQKAAHSLRLLGIKHDDMQIVVRLNEILDPGVFESALVNRGFSESNARFFESSLRGGKIFIAVHNIDDAAPVTEIFERNSADYCPGAVEGRIGELNDAPLHWVNYLVKP